MDEERVEEEDNEGVEGDESFVGSFDDDVVVAADKLGCVVAREERL